MILPRSPGVGPTPALRSQRLQVRLLLGILTHFRFSFPNCVACNYPAAGYCFVGVRVPSQGLSQFSEPSRFGVNHASQALRLWPRNTNLASAGASLRLS